MTEQVVAGRPTQVVCECCSVPLPVGTRAMSNADGVVICVECFEALRDQDGAS